MTCGALGDRMTEVELSAGSIQYEDTGGEGPVVVLCHGLLMTASLWDAVVAELRPGLSVCSAHLAAGRLPTTDAPGGRTLIPIDQPCALAGAVTTYIGNL
jgi:pimeloyl-ACP methyl ester carboxylesterase